jgi:hypothetical protein
VFVELDRRQNDGLIVSLEWDRETGKTQIVVEDARDEGGDGSGSKRRRRVPPPVPIPALANRG